MTVSLVHLVFDCADPVRVAAFWSDALGRDVDPGGSEFFASIGRPVSSSGKPAWFFIRVPEAKAGKNRVHVDLAASDGAAEVRPRAHRGR